MFSKEIFMKINICKKINTLLLLGFFLTFVNSLFAEQARYHDDNFALTVYYNETVVPGEAIFVKMIYEPSKAAIKSKNFNLNKANLLLYAGEKMTESAPFYQTEKSKGNVTNYLCGVPVSLWASEADYKLKVVISISDKENLKEFSLPLKFQSKKWNKEVIDLDSKNSEIKNDMSPERTAQIEKLNNILFTTNLSDVFDTAPFVCPTTSTRYTAFCGDRRTYTYVNGKSSTSVHYGNDYGIPTGSEVRACAKGKVVMAEWRISTGWSVVIEHLPGLYSLYYHCSELNVQEGQMVNKNDLIALSGDTGLATGPHLHWEIRLNGSAVVPEFFMTDFAFTEK